MMPDTTDTSRSARLHLKRLSAIPLAFFVISAFAVAQQPKKASPVTNVAGPVIAGTILDGLINKPVAGVVMTMLQGTARRDLTTDSSGQFAFNATHGTVRLISAKRGYAALRPEGHQMPT